MGQGSPERWLRRLRCRAALHDAGIVPDVIDGLAEEGRRVGVRLAFGSAPPILYGALLRPEQVRGLPGFE